MTSGSLCECRPDKFSSRLCERGTKGCNVAHGSLHQFLRQWWVEFNKPRPSAVWSVLTGWVPTKGEHREP